jgi:hypothetical protein
MHRAELSVIGHISEQDWNRMKDSVRAALAILRRPATESRLV